MTIYFVGTTVSDFESRRGAYQISDNATLDAFGNTRIYFPAASLGWSTAQKDLDTVVTGTLWLGFLFSGTYYTGANADWTINYDIYDSFLGLLDGEGNPVLKVGSNPNVSLPFQIRVYLRDGSVVDLTDLPDPYPTNTGTNDKWDIKVQPGVGFSIYFNRSLYYTYSGDLGNSASTVNGIGRISLGTGDGGAGCYWSSILCADFDTRFARVSNVTLSTTPSVDTSSATLGVAISNYISGGTLEEYDTNQYSTFDAVGEKIIFPENDTVTLADGQVIVGVVTSYRALETGASPAATLVPTLEIASTEYTGTGIPLTTSRKVHQQTFATNPATSSAWQPSDLEGIGYGLIMNT
jgi:hypothetical protein